MSRKEREQLTILVGVKEQELTLVQASELMGVCCRQSKRIWRRYQDDGDAGLAQAKRVKTPTTVKPPSANHLWRRFGMGVGRNYWRGVKAHGRAERLGLRDSGRPALRSGLPAARNPNRGKGATNNNQKRGHSLVS